MSALPSAEVALDFQDSLNDLQINNRYEISNLTIIAKENTEHAQAISRTLENHIRKTAPSRKLPALYVLDSIVKNVGTPYTVYLGRNLFSTFMDAYTLVDGLTRKSMEGMLKTWKEPVPGSMDPRPVFSPEVTRVIENALIKARTVAIQHQQQARPQRQQFSNPPRPNPVDYRNTPTPPQNGARYGTPAQHSFQNAYPHQQSAPQPYAGSQPNPDLARALLATLGQQDPARELNKLHEDVNGLISQSQADFARDPLNQSFQQRLKALLDLQSILKSQQLSPEAIKLIKTQVAQLAAAAPQPAPTPSFPQAHVASWQPPTPVAQPYQPPPVPQPSVSAFAPGALEALLASTANGQKPSTPTLRSALPAIQNPSANILSPRSANAAPVPASGNALVDALRAAGLVTGSSSTPVPASNPPPQAPPVLTADILKSLQNLPPLSNRSAPQMPPAQVHAQPPKPRIPLHASALKIFRPDLLATLYDAQPNQCTTCGRRFAPTDAGRSAKSAHLDWHFRTNQRIADAVHKGQHRSWYVDELDWIKLAETDLSIASADDETAAAALAAANGGAVGGADGSGPGRPRKKDIRDSYIPAPTGAAAAANAACPICQERFEPIWHDEAQEWVWMDAVRIGGRVYHASCHDEVKKAAGGAAALGLGIGDQRARSATPDGGVLGKRKAEGGGLLGAKRGREG